MVVKKWEKSSTNEKFENSNNSYSTFLSDKGELPKLSILDNYKEITRIMTYSYIKGSDYEKKFGNRLASENEKDEEEEYDKMKSLYDDATRNYLAGKINLVLQY